jgi:hypothetical protein
MLVIAVRGLLNANFDFKILYIKLFEIVWVEVAEEGVCQGRPMEILKYFKMEFHAFHVFTGMFRSF